MSVHPFRRGALLIGLALVVEYLVLPQIGGVTESLHVLGQVNVGYLLLGVLLEMASLLSYAELTKTLLPAGSSSISRLFRIDMAMIGVSHVLPGGAATAEGLGYRLLTKEGIAGADAGLALGIQGIGSAIILIVIWTLALIVSIPLTGFDATYAVFAGIGILILGAVAALAFLMTRGEEHARAILRSVVIRVPFLKAGAADAADRAARHIADRVRGMAADRRLLRQIALWSMGNWLLDAASLFVFLTAFGHVENPDGLLVTYGLAYALAYIPLTPGGLGIVEAVLVPGLAGFGAPRAVAIVGVISYRLVNFWLPIPVGAGCYLSLRLPGRRQAKRREELRDVLEEARHHEHVPRDFSGEHGMLASPPEG